MQNLGQTSEGVEREEWMKRTSRFGLAAVLSAALSIAFSGVAAADTITGVVGHYNFNDLSTFQAAGVTCRYEARTLGSSVFDLYKIVGRAPSVWWPDTNSSISGQHGTVGWQMIVKHKQPASSTWILLKKTTVQKATAHEDSPAFDSNDKAPLTNKSVSINRFDFSGPSSEQFMVTKKIIWYKADGTVKGTASHDNIYYRNYEGSTPRVVLANQFCYLTYLKLNP